MDLREIGTMLREERERQGLSLDTVADKIKISRSCLVAIEEGNESVLPHPVYAKGFIKNYAKILGVDQGEFTAQLSSLYQLEESGRFRDMATAIDTPDDDCGCGVTSVAPRPPVKLLALGALGLLLVVGIVWFALAHVFSSPQGESPDGPASRSDAAKPVPPAALEPTPSAPVTPAPVVAAPAPVLPAAPPVSSVPPVPPVPVAITPTVPAPPGVGPTPAEPAKPAQDAAPRGGLTPEDKATQDIANSGPTAPVPAVPPAPETASTVPGAPAQTATAKSFTVGETGPHVVSIVANERCWLQAGADGGSMHETMLEKGDTFTGRFTDYLLVRLGNAGAVEIHFDNKLYPFQAGKGSVKTLKFVAKKTDAAPTAPAATAPAAAPVVSASPAAVSPAPAAEGTAGGKEVEIFGQDGSWVIISADKAPAKEIYVKKGQRITVPFSEKMEVKLGNPSSVVFRYEGKETPVSTEKGGTKSIRFP